MCGQRGEDVVAQPEKENLILNQNDPISTSYTYSVLLSSSFATTSCLHFAAAGKYGRGKVEKSSAFKTKISYHC
jgi:hypothetical protein